VPGVAAALGGAIANFFGFRVLFLAMLAASLVGTVVSLQVLRRS
jgi:predicted MFS family arabinose efflux permease